MSWEFKDQAIYAEIGKLFEKSFLILPSFKSSLSVTVVRVLSSSGTNLTETRLVVKATRIKCFAERNLLRLLRART